MSQQRQQLLRDWESEIWFSPGAMHDSMLNPAQAQYMVLSRSMKATKIHHLCPLCPGQWH